MQEEKIKKGFTINQKWIFAIVFNILLLLIGYKIVFADYLIDLTKFTFSDFLALFLALFSIAISVAFYFKATDSSSRFYDNTYKFTKDIAELLVKIESSFGERLKHLDEGYTSIRDKFDKIPSSTITKEKVQTQEELDEVKKEFEKKLKEKETLLNDTLQKAHSNEKDRKFIINQLNKKEVELQLEKEKVELLEEKLMSYNNLERERSRKFIPPSTKMLWMHSILIPLGEKFIKNASYTELNKKFQENLKNFSEKALLDVYRYGMMDKDKNLTEEGFHYLKELANNTGVI
ncbi:MAG: hypothetical protein IPM56_11780 [Ignavibacteriales bacterium]|nr:MAG: hypothetical protein IPM56_11780 [Ignavibacteriales bacterium]